MLNHFEAKRQIAMNKQIAYCYTGDVDGSWRLAHFERTHGYDPLKLLTASVGQWRREANFDKSIFFETITLILS